MRKKVAVIFFCFLLSIGNFVTVFGEIKVSESLRSSSHIEYSDAILYLNGAPIRAYTDGGRPKGDDGIEMYYNLIRVEDLVRYGFEVNKDEKAKTLKIQRIPGKQPDPQTEEEYKELTTRKRVTLATICYGNYNMDVYFGERAFPNAYDRIYRTEEGTFVPTEFLARFYGSRELNGEESIEKLTLIYDFPVCKTELTDYVYFERKPLMDFVVEQRKDVKWKLEMLQYRGDSYDEKMDYYYGKEDILIRPFYRNNEGPGVSVSAYYRKVDKKFDEHNIQYQFTEDALIIPKNQKDAKGFIEYYNHLDENGFDLYYFDSGALEPTNCVDIKLMAGEEPFRTDELFPPLISVDSQLYIRTDALMDIIRSPE